MRHEWSIVIAILCSISFVNSDCAAATTYKAKLLKKIGYDYTIARDSSGDIHVGHGYPPGTASRALLWNEADNSIVSLHPAGYYESFAWGASGNQQVGYAYPQLGDIRHAFVWNGSAGSAVNLHPAGYGFSIGIDNSENSQVGVGGNVRGPIRALLWHGTPESVVELHPATGYFYTGAEGVAGEWQAGYGLYSATSFVHALLWHGTAESVIDLHPSGFSNTYAFGISEANQVGSGWGSATSHLTHALLWTGAAESVVDLHPSDSFSFSEALDTNGDTQVGFGLYLGAHHALAWQGTASSVVDLHTSLEGLGPTFVLSQALGVNEAGEIFGYGFDGAVGYAVKWSPVPEPGSGALVAMAIAAVANLTRVRRRL